MQCKIPEKYIRCIVVMNECYYSLLMLYVVTIPSIKAIDSRTWRHYGFIKRNQTVINIRLKASKIGSRKVGKDFTHQENQETIRKHIEESNFTSPFV